MSHDLAVVAELCDRIYAFYAGQVVESGPVEEIVQGPATHIRRLLERVASGGDFRRRQLEVIPGSPPQVGMRTVGCSFADRCRYAIGTCISGDVQAVVVGDHHEVRRARANESELSDELLADDGTAPAQLRLDGDPSPPPLLEVGSLEVVLGRGWRANKVLSGVNLQVNPGEIIGLVGETGSGKTTLARAIVGLVRPRRGRVRFDGVDIWGLRGPGAARPSPPGRRAVRVPRPASLARPRPHRRAHCGGGLGDPGRCRRR